MPAAQPRPVPELLDAVTAVPPRDANAEDRLLCVDGDQAWTVALPTSGGLVFGRSAQADVVLADPRASRAHARLTVTPTELIVTDLASRHGTLINGAPLVGARAVVSGDVIAIGGARVIVSRRSGPRLSATCERAYLHERLADELARASARGRTVALIAVRIAGAAQVGALATLADRAEAGEVSGRLDDGHLAVVAPELDASDAAERGAALAAALDAAVGVAVAPFDGADPATVIAAARAAAARAAVGAALSAASTIEVMTLAGRRAVLADPAMVELYALVRRLAQVDVPVVIHGETGTGKELVAAALHALSPRARGPMIAINCAAIPAELAEAELFGHARGAFTGAVAARPGQLEAASGGTLFLDEIAELSLGDAGPAPAGARGRRGPAPGREPGPADRRSGGGRVAPGPAGRGRGRPVPGRSPVPPRGRAGRGAAAAGPAPRPRGPRLDAGRRRLRAHGAPADDRRRQRGVGAGAAVVARQRPRAPPHPRGRHRDRARRCPRAGGPAPAAGRVVAGRRGGRTAGRSAVERDRAVERVTAPSSVEAAPSSAAQFRPIADELAALERARMVEALRVASGVQVRAAELLAMPIRTFATKLRRYAIEPEDWGAP
jgi:two-component system response regulator AtoC